MTVRAATLYFALTLSLAGHSAQDSPPQNPYETDVAIIAYEIQLRPDFATNSVMLDVRAQVKNLSAKPYAQLEIDICSTSSGSGMRATGLRVLTDGGADEIPLTVVEMTAPEMGEGFYTPEVPIYRVELEEPLQPGTASELIFRYTLQGQASDRGLPLWGMNRGSEAPPAEHGELYLIQDFRWLPSVYCPIKKGQFQNTFRPSWELRMEYPAAFTAAVDGQLLEREEKEETCVDRWRSIVGGGPHIFISRYAVTKGQNGPLQIEIYTPPVASLQRSASALLDDIGKTLALYFEMYGDPGGKTYRLVASHTNWGGHGNFMGQSIYFESLARMNYRTVAHELAHTWWGTAIRSYGDGSKFLREAFAEFSSLWAIGELKGERQFKRELSKYKTGLFRRMSRGQLTPLIQRGGRDSRAIVSANYSKGPVVVNALRVQMGDEAFFSGLKAFAQEYNNKNVTFRDFVAVLNRFSGVKLDSYLRNLCRSTGYPSYVLHSFSCQEKGDGFETTVTLTNEGDFGLRCPIGLCTEDGNVLATFEVESKKAKELHFVTNSRVIDVLIDPERTAFQYHSSQDSEERKAMARAFVRPTPKPGLTYGATFENVSEPAEIRRNYNTCMISVEDFDRDGLLDFYLSTMGYSTRDRDTGQRISHAHPNVLFHNQGTLSFAEHSRKAKLLLKESTTDVATADFNNDGYPDPIVSQLGTRGEDARTLLFRSRPDGTYEEVAKSLNMERAMKGKALWIDIDGDNDLDFITVGGVHRNDGEQGFTETTTESSLTFYKHPMFLIPIDYDCDNRTDIVCAYRAGRTPGPSVQVIHNQGNGQFAEVTQDVGLSETDIGSLGHAAAADVNNDGYPDILIGNRLFVNEEGKRFVEQEAALPGDFPVRGLGTGDFDNDGDLDVFIPSSEEHRLYANLGDGRFEDVAVVAGLIEGVHIGMPITADFDNDGDLDLLLPEKSYPGSEQEHLFENVGAEGNSLTVLPVTDGDGDASDANTGDDRTAVGARVEVTAVAASGDLVRMTRWITAGQESMNAPVAHFGLGKAENANLRVVFPDGTLVEKENVPANQRVTVRDR